MRLEEEYRRRLHEVTKEVKKRLNYQVCRKACFQALLLYLHLHPFIPPPPFLVPPG